MDVLWCNCIFLLSVLFLILKFSAGLGIIENRMLSEKDVMIASSQTTIEHTVRSKLICATLCIRNGFCMAVSYKNTKCYVETETNFSVDPNIGAMTMRLAGLLSYHTISKKIYFTIYVIYQYVASWFYCAFSTERYLVCLG